jgi:integrase
MRVSEAVGLRRGDMDWKEFHALIIGKGDQEAIVRFSTRAVEAITPYLRLRAELGYIFNGPVSSMPLFSRHDKGAGKKVKPISTATGRNIIKQRLLECLGPDALGSITPHSFRHFFVTTVLRASSGNLKLAQELARHKNIQVTQRYAHLSNDELDRGYHEIFEN